MRGLVGALARNGGAAWGDPLAVGALIVVGVVVATVPLVGTSRGAAERREVGRSGWRAEGIVTSPGVGRRGRIARRGWSGPRAGPGLRGDGRVVDRSGRQRWRASNAKIR